MLAYFWFLPAFVLHFVNCSQTKFVVTILVLFVFLCNFLLDRCFVWPMIFRPEKRNKQVASSGHWVFLEPFSSLVSNFAVHRNCFGDLYVWCEGWLLRCWTPIPHNIPPPPPTSVPSLHSPNLHLCTSFRPEGPHAAKDPIPTVAANPQLSPPVAPPPAALTSRPFN